MENNLFENPIYNEIYDFIKKEIGIKITENTIFFSDLNLIGDDADEFMLRFSKRFQIDMSEFKFNDYFIDEYSTPFLYLFDKWFRKEKLKKCELDLTQLEKIIKNKKWIKH